MEKYSFIKFLKIKKKEIIKNIKNLKNQTGGSPTVETYNDHMLNLILLNEQLASLKDVTDNTSVITYDGLSDAIKKIETKIEEHSKLQKTKSESLNPYELINIIESINHIDESLDQNSYFLTANREFYSVPEKVSTGPESEVGKFSKFITDITTSFLSQKQNLESLNELDMKKIITDVEKKNDELDLKIEQIEAKKNKILELTSNMQQLHSFNLEATVKPKEPASDGFKSKKIPTFDDDTKPFGDLETNVESMMDLVEIFRVDPILKGGSNKYPKKFLKINIDKNIINLYNEWLETLKNYKNKLKGELNNKLESKKLIGGKINTKIKFKNKLDTNVLIGGVDVEPSFNKAFLKFEEKIIIIRQKMKELTLIIKRYNVMYIQLINFQNFITNFISVKVLQGGYIVYMGLDFALVSHYQNMLSELIKIIIFLMKHLFLEKNLIIMNKIV